MGPGAAHRPKQKHSSMLYFWRILPLISTLLGIFKYLCFYYNGEHIFQSLFRIDTTCADISIREYPAMHQTLMCIFTTFCIFQQQSLDSMQIQKIRIRIQRKKYKVEWVFGAASGVVVFSLCLSLYFHLQLCCSVGWYCIGWGGWASTPDGSTPATVQLLRPTSSRLSSSPSTSS